MAAKSAALEKLDLEARGIDTSKTHLEDLGPYSRSRQRKVSDR